VTHRDDPVLIGAIGGSGTRAFAKVLRRAGVHMGPADTQEDATAFSDFYQRFLAEYLENGSRFPEGSSAPEHFDAAVSQHLAGVESPEAPWGAKNPRSMLMLAYWHERYPRMRFVHVVRNGLDMAYSTNQIQPKRFGELILDGEPPGSKSKRAMVYWSQTNSRAADYGESRLGERYIRIRHEDLCLSPEATVARLFEFLGVEDRARLEAAVAEVSRPPDIGRWRQHPIGELAKLVELGGEALRRFGYWSPTLERSFDDLVSRSRRSAARRLVIQRFALKRLPIA
jgi:Sulfotransferase family